MSWTVRSYSALDASQQQQQRRRRQRRQQQPRGAWGRLCARVAVLAAAADRHLAAALMPSTPLYRLMLYWWLCCWSWEVSKLVGIKL